MYTIIVSGRNGEMDRYPFSGSRKEANAFARTQSVPNFCTAHVHFGSGPVPGKVRKFKRRGPPHPKRCGKESTADPFGILLATLEPLCEAKVRHPARLKRNPNLGRYLYHSFPGGKPAERMEEGYR